MNNRPAFTAAAQSLFDAMVSGFSVYLLVGGSLPTVRAFNRNIRRLETLTGIYRGRLIEDLTAAAALRA